MDHSVVSLVTDRTNGLKRRNNSTDQRDVNGNNNKRLKTEDGQALVVQKPLIETVLYNLLSYSTIHTFDVDVGGKFLKKDDIYRKHGLKSQLLYDCLMSSISNSDREYTTLHCKSTYDVEYGRVRITNIIAFFLMSPMRFVYNCGSNIGDHANGNLSLYPHFLSELYRRHRKKVNSTLLVQIVPLHNNNLHPHVQGISDLLQDYMTIEENSGNTSGCNIIVTNYVNSVLNNENHPAFEFVRYMRSGFGLHNHITFKKCDNTFENTLLLRTLTMFATATAKKQQQTTLIQPSYRDRLILLNVLLDVIYEQKHMTAVIGKCNIINGNIHAQFDSWVCSAFESVGQIFSAYLTEEESYVVEQLHMVKTKTSVQSTKSISSYRVRLKECLSNLIYSYTREIDVSVQNEETTHCDSIPSPSLSPSLPILYLTTTTTTTT